MVKSLAIMSILCTALSVLTEPCLCAAYRRNRRANNEETKCCWPKKYAWIMRRDVYYSKVTGDGEQQIDTDYSEVYAVVDGVRSYASFSANSYGNLLVAEPNSETHVTYDEQDECFLVKNYSFPAANETIESEVCVDTPLVSVEQINGITYYIYLAVDESDNFSESEEIYTIRDESQVCLPQYYKQKKTSTDRGSTMVTITSIVYQIIEFGPEQTSLLQIPPESQRCSQSSLASRKRMRSS